MSKKTRSHSSDDVENPTEYRVTGTLDLCEITDLKPDIPLRVAAVHDQKIITSRRIELESDGAGELEFELEFTLPGRCGFQFLVHRGDIPDQDVLGPESHSTRVSLAQMKAKNSDKNPLRANLGTITLPDSTYQHWIRICRTYTVRGRVVCRHWRYDSDLQQFVFQDLPVPGATVEALDVNCWWWWCLKDRLGTAVTDENGRFEIEFTWCCRTWIPWDRPWVVDPDLLEHIRDLLEQSPRPFPEPPTDPFDLQEYLRDLTARQGQPASLGRFSKPEREPTNLTSGQPHVSAQALTSVLPDSPKLEAMHVWPWWNPRDCSPNLSFRVTQPCGGDVTVIYEEDRSQTRWNVSTETNVTLEANDQACCLPDQPEPPCGNCLAIWEVGCTDVGNIGQSSGPPDLRGYAYTASGRDRPFGGTLVFKGEFGEESLADVDYYRVQYRNETAGGTWKDTEPVAGLLGGISRKYWDCDAYPDDCQSPGIHFGPMERDGLEVYKTKSKYQRDHAADEPGFGWLWDDADHLFKIDSRSLPGGDALYSFRVVGYRETSDGSLDEVGLMPVCGTEDHDTPAPATVMVRVDNRNEPHPPSTADHPCGPGYVHVCTAEPDCDFVKITKNEDTAAGTEIPPCGDIEISDDDRITVHFLVSTPSNDKDAHLGGYNMTAHYGESGLIKLINPSDVTISLEGDPTPHFGPSYSEALTQGPVGSISRPHWQGGHFKVTFPGSVFPVSCAYLFRLRAWKRTFDGCHNPSWFHWNLCEFSFCVDRA